MYRKIKTILLILCIMLSCSYVLPLSVHAASSANTDEIGTIDAGCFKGKKIGVLTGSIYEQVTPQLIDDADLQLYTNMSGMITALKSNKVSALVHDEPAIRYMASETDGIKYAILDDNEDPLAILSRKDAEGKKLIGQFNKFLSKIEADGELENIKKKWFDGSENDRTMEDYSDYPDINGTLVIASESAFAPFEYMKDGLLVGYEIELVALFCKEYGYKPQFENVEFAGILSGVTSGKYDIGASGFSITDERKEIAFFSEPIYISYAAVAYVDNDYNSHLLSWNGIKESINKTFIKEDRWKLFADGIKVTLEITIFSIILGTLLGLLIHMLCRNGNRMFNYISRFLTWLIKGMPEVVLLMILYYVVFGGVDISGVTVAIIGFTLCFTCTMHSMLETGERSLDPGQYRASEALGYTNIKAFFRIILPQSARIFMPDYISSVSTHIKATAIVGYIAVVDITRVADIVRGRTYEAFFPLIAIAVLYFIMAGFLKVIVRVCTSRLDYEKRSSSQILKGVELR